MRIEELPDDGTAFLALYMQKVEVMNESERRMMVRIIRKMYGIEDKYPKDTYLNLDKKNEKQV